jgi:hypothetical protein
VSIDLTVTSRPVDTVAAWVSAGWKAGIGLGSVYGAVIGWLGSPVLSLAGLGLGCVFGFLVGVAAGALDGLLLGLLARPLRLSPGTRSARLRAAVAAAVITGLALLLLGLTPLFPFEALAALIAISVPTAAVVALRPAGRVADPEARVRIQAR